ncbi:MAG TPA: vitamin K epoxide reductase family protein, partial [Anaerolineae bacterium]
RQGVPTLVVNDVVLVGSEEIPKQFPVIVMTGLAAGGLTWPDIPGLDQVLPADAGRTGPASGQAAATVAPNNPNPVTAAADDPALSVEVDDSAADPVGFVLGGLILAGMVIAFGYVAWRVGKVWPRVRRLNRNFTVQAKTWTVPFLALAGLGVAAYLVYVEISQVEAVCGPIGQCNAVQASPYARIFGLPVAGLGLLNYLAIGLLWLGQRYDPDKIAGLSVWGLLSLTIFGTLFSIYLTLLELFVIRAVCLWCLSSAIITALLMVLVVASLTNDIKPNKLARSH